MPTLIISDKDLETRLYQCSECRTFALLEPLMKPTSAKCKVCDSTEEKVFVGEITWSEKWLRKNA